MSLCTGPFDSAKAACTPDDKVCVSAAKDEFYRCSNPLLAAAGPGSFGKMYSKESAADAVLSTKFGSNTGSGELVFRGMAPTRLPATMDQCASAANAALDTANPPDRVYCFQQTTAPYSNHAGVYIAVCTNSDSVTCPVLSTVMTTMNGEVSRCS